MLLERVQCLLEIDWVATSAQEYLLEDGVEHFVGSLLFIELLLAW